MSKFAIFVCISYMPVRNHIYGFYHCTKPDKQQVVMSALTDLISQIENPELRARIQAEIERANKQKKFGLVFEEHLPESTPLYDIPIKVGGFVSTREKGSNGFVLMKVLSIADGTVRCITQAKEIVSYPIDALVTVAPFGEPIYPYLKPIDSICNAPDSDLWHTLIEADNYHALQLLEYLYAGKVDCIYIDPPYNTGAHDWKYNNDYVDGTDSYRHSKWLSMMEKRLKLASKLLNPISSVLIITIDEKEYHHLACLLEQIFPEAQIQMVSSVINHAGNGRQGDFCRTNEFIYFVMFGECKLTPLDQKVAKNEEVVWDTLRRHNPASIRPARPKQFYPIYIDIKTKKIVKIGEAITPDVDRFSVPSLEGCATVFPVKDNGVEMMWGVVAEECRRRYANGYIKIGQYNPNKPQQFPLQMLSAGTIKDIQDGKVQVIGTRDDGSVIAIHPGGKKVLPKSQWDKETHDARYHGTELIRKIIGDRFSYPKSLYAVHDCVKLFVGHNPNALIIDFFAGSGTTLHAVNLLNAEDNGNRRCIMVTNNEVSEEESKTLASKGFHPGSYEWDSLGIARYVNWPRTKCSILGTDIDGNPIKGEYITTREDPFPISEGFKANAAFFKLGFLDKRSVALGHQFKELLPVLWMKAGAIGPCPKVEEDILPEWLILSQNKMAILLDETAFPAFEELIREQPDICTLYLVTDSEKEFIAMSISLNIKNTYQLYRDYLDNFRINRNR